MIFNNNNYFGNVLWVTFSFRQVYYFITLEIPCIIFHVIQFTYKSIVGCIFNSVGLLS
jgi:hypothetical protein